MASPRAIRLTKLESESNMTKTIQLSKKLKHFDGTDVVKKGNIILPISAPPKGSTEEVIGSYKTNAETILGDNLWKWAVQGYLAHARSVGSNLLTGSTDKDLKKLLRQFKEAHRTLVDVMDVKVPEAFTTLIGKKKFETLVPYFENLKAVTETSVFDYTETELPTPRWFKGEEDEEEEEEGDDDES